MTMEKMIIVKNGRVCYKPDHFDDGKILSVEDILDLPKSETDFVLRLIMGQLDMYENDHRDKYSRFVAGERLLIRYCRLKKFRCPFVE